MLFSLRVLGVCGQTLALLVARQLPDSPVALIVLVNCVAPFAVANLLTLIHARRHNALSDASFFRQIVVDLVVLTYMIGASGGASNPWHGLLFLPLVVAAASLPARWVWGTTAIGVGCYMLVSYFYMPLPDGPASTLQVLEVSRWLDDSLLAIGLSYFVLRMARSMRQREQELAALRERETRAGCAIVLGSVAAGAAHELGTPLSTIATELDELKAAHGDQADIGRSLSLMQASVGACLHSLQSLRLAGSAPFGDQKPMAADQLVQRIVKRFHDMRPGAHVELQVDSVLPAPRVMPDLGLQQAIVNVLGNAAHVSPQYVKMVVRWSAGTLRVRVIDHGPGFPPDILSRLGNTLLSTKPPAEGRGVGLFLTQMTASRLGGRLELTNAPEGGAVAEISVPLDMLKMKEASDG